MPDRPTKSWAAMGAEYDRLRRVLHDPASTIPVCEFAVGALWALHWAYSPRHRRPSSMVATVRLPEHLPRGNEP